MDIDFGSSTVSGINSIEDGYSNLAARIILLGIEEADVSFLESNWHGDLLDLALRTTMKGDRYKIHLPTSGRAPSE